MTQIKLCHLMKKKKNKTLNCHDDAVLLIKQQAQTPLQTS